MKQFLAFLGGTLTDAASKADAAVAATSPENLAVGAIAIGAKDGASGKFVIVDAAAEFADVKEFFVLRGTSDGFVVSDGMERKSLNVKKQAAVNGVARVVTLSAIPATLPKGTVVEVGIVDNNATIMTDWKTTRLAYKTTVANQAASVIAAGLAASANASTSSGKKKNLIVNVAAATNDLTFTSKNPGDTFSVFLGEGLEGVASLAVTTQGVNAEGDVASLTELQLECEGYQGRTNYVDRTTGPTKDSNQLATSGTYVLYTLSCAATTTRLAVATDPVAQRFKRLYLAIPTGATAIATLDTLIGAASLEEVAAQAEEVGA